MKSKRTKRLNKETLKKIQKLKMMMDMTPTKFPKILRLLMGMMEIQMKNLRK